MQNSQMGYFSKASTYTRHKGFKNGDHFWFRTSKQVFEGLYLIISRRKFIISIIPWTGPSLEYHNCGCRSSKVIQKLNVKGIFLSKSWFKIRFSWKSGGAKSVSLKSVGAAAPTAPTLTTALCSKQDLQDLTILTVSDLIGSRFNHEKWCHS